MSDVRTTAEGEFIEELIMEDFQVKSGRLYLPGPTYFL